MQNVSYDLTNILGGSVRDFVPVDLIEFYEPDQTSLVPGNAVKRFANTKLAWYGWEYEQQAISRGSTMRYVDERFNTCSLTFSNIDRELGRWLSSTSIAGYRVLIRAISRSVDNQSIVLFVGRCEKPFSVNNSTVSLTIKQDLGSINSELPARKFTHACPLKFKGTECQGEQTSGQKSTAYNNAATCDKSWQQCVQYANTDFFQGFRSTNVTGSFVLRESALGIPKKSTKQWSSQDATPINEHVPMGLGRTQIELTPIASADTGQFLYGHWVAGEGPITKFLNTRNVTPGFARRFEGQNTDGTPTGTGSYREHLGEYGNDSDQRSVSDFLGYVSHSRRAYIEGTIRGQNPDTGDPAPTIVSTILWNPIPTPGRNQKYDGEEWTDNPVHQVRHLLTNERTLQYPVNLIDDQAAIETARYCDEPLYDRSGGEDLVVAQNSDTTSDSFINGRFRSTGLIDPFFWRRRRIATEPESAAQYASINYFSTRNLTGYDEFGQPIYEEVPPPTNLVPNEYFRKRYTANWHLKKGVKVSDFLFKQLLPSFKGYLVTGADGRLQIRSERAAVQSRSSGAVTTSMNTIDVYDGIQFKDLSLPVKYLLIRNPESTITRTSIRRIVSVDYLAASNGITIGAPSSGAATMNCKIYGADLDSTNTTFTGGSISTQAYAYIIVTDGLSQNSTAGVRIDGVDVGGGGPIGNTSAYASQNWSPEIAAMIATNLNGNPNLKNVNGVPLRDYIEAVWEPSNPLMVLFRSKQATLILDAPFTIDHPAGDLATHFHLPFSDGSDGLSPNILKDSFEWPLGNRQSAYNQFTIIYQDAVQDSQSVAIVENDYDHQEATNQINKLEVPGGDCVDNYHQADRLLLAARYKYRESDFFVQFQTAGLGMLLEEGDLILVNHSSMPLYRNYLYRIEELSVSQDHRVSITARLYSDLQYPEQAVAKTVPLVRSNAWPTTALPAVTNLSISRIPSSGNTARISFRFPSSVTQPLVRVYVQRRDPDTGEFIDNGLTDTGIILRPDVDNNGIVEIPGLVTGSFVQLVPFTETGIQGESIPIGIPELPTDTGGTGAGVTDGDKGDVVVSGSGATWTIDTDAVTYAKMQNMAADRVLGRRSTTGDPEELTLTQTLDLVGSAAQGDILYRGASTWTRLGAGTRGRYLQTGGASANPSWAQAATFKNLVINGDMRVDQRRNGGSATINTATNTYTVDRWLAVGQSSDGIFTVQRSTTAPTAFANTILATVSTADTTANLGATQFYGISQYIEGFNAAQLLWGTANALTVTLSFWVRASITGTFGGAIRNGAANRSYPFTYTIDSANTFEYKTITIAGDTSGTWATNNTSGPQIWFSLAAGASRSGTAGAWNGNNNVSATGAVNFMDQNSRTFYLTGVQLEVGSVATEYEYLPIEEQLAQCQRYCATLRGQGWRKFAGCTSDLSSTLYTTYYCLPVEMRIAPSMSFSALGDFKLFRFNDASQGDPTAIVVNINSTTTISLTVTTGSGSSGAVCFLYGLNSNALLTFDAEL